ncbi:MAG: FAD-binding oxidoreductase [Pseudomonadota bacterium]
MPVTTPLQKITRLNSNTYQLRFQRDEPFDWKPGQAVRLAFVGSHEHVGSRLSTPISLPGDDHLDFIVKVYPDGNGFTEKLPSIRAGQSFRLTPAYGTLFDRGPGVLVAGGSGITPFLSILRSRLDETGTLDGYKLIYCNQRYQDIVLKEELFSMAGLEVILVLSDEAVSGTHFGRIDKKFIERETQNLSKKFYICGPAPMEADVSEMLEALGVSASNIIRDERTQPSILEAVNVERD